jgi:hypothetical protein
MTYGKKNFILNFSQKSRETGGKESGLAQKILERMEDLFGIQQNMT